MLILADTNIWVDHLHHGHERLAAWLAQSQVVVHPMIIGELACGSLRQRDKVLRLLQLLPRACVASDEAVLDFLHEHKLYSKGLGWVDMHLLCATAMTPHCRLWTNDQRLKAQAQSLNLLLDNRQ